MQTKALVLNILNVKEHEAQPMVYMLFHAFLNGLGISLSFTAVNVLILENHGIHVLPYLYVITSVLLLIGGLTYSRIEHQVKPARLFPASIAICALWAISIRLSLGLSESLLVVGLGFCTYYIVYYLCNLEFWGAAALLFDVRQGKRLFGPLSFGESVAKILGYSITPVIITSLSLPDALLVAGLAFLLSWYLVSRMVKKYPSYFHSHSKHHIPPARKSRRFMILGLGNMINLIRKDNFARYVSAFAMISSLTYFAIHYGFMEQVEERFHSHSLEEVAYFFGIFLGIAKAINLLIKIFLSSRILNYFGVRIALMVMPVALLLINLLGIIGFFNFTTGTQFFILIFSLNYLVDEVFRSSLYTPSYLILFQPLAKNKRLEGHTLSKGIMEPMGMGIAGAFILLLDYSGTFTLPVLTMCILGFSFVWVFITFRLNKEYLRILNRALKSRVLNRFHFNHSREELGRLRNEKLTSDDPYEVLYAANMLKDDLGLPEWDAVVSKLIKSENSGIQIAALEIIEGQGLADFSPAVKMLIFSDNPSVMEKAVYCYTALMEEESVPELIGYIQESDEARRLAIIGGILKHSGLYGAVSTGEDFLSLITSDKEKDRMHAAQIIGRIGNPKYYHPLLILLADPSPLVRKTAVIASNTVLNDKLIEPILQLINKRGMIGHCMNVMEKFGETAMPHIRNNAATATSADLKLLIRICSRIPETNSFEFLLPHINSDINTVRNEAIYSLFVAKYNLSDHGTPLVQTCINNEIELLGAMLPHYRKSKAEPLIHSAIHNEINEILLPRILHLLSFIYDRQTIIKILDNTRIISGDYRSIALELMDNMLHRKHSRKLCSVLENVFEMQKIDGSKRNEDFAQEAFIQFVFKRPPGDLSEWMQAICVRSARQVKLKMEMSGLFEANGDSSRVLKEEVALYESFKP